MYFRRIASFGADTFIVAAHAVYGWMPTILELAIEDENDLKRAASALNRAREEFFRDEDLEHLVRVVNNSLVGASKLLHFTSPERFAIWDSKVYRFVFNKKPHHYRLNDIEDFAKYHDVLRRLAQDEEQFSFLRSEVIAKVGYDVTPLRALELVMFCAPR
jgi:hypothetical protein